ncbi:hypothetical protein DM02DRAFT_633850 [Periconia macrospinosa]|uniref:Rhodopsin domain-containing protein n=1 Tax=Periconia macrospinosa TaxID=97972 RepID=A0A2V1DAT2_9PLEO|nr:hypothetical protein DM02DRAFT_633850 [Periconia macrospinosa]
MAKEQSQVPLINSLCITFSTLSTVSVILRLYTRKKLLNVVGVDDITISIAQVLAIAVSVLTVLEAHFGLGRHTPTVPPESLIRQLKSLYAVTILYNLAQSIVKIAFLILYRRLFPAGPIQLICRWFLVFIVVWGIVQEFVVAFACIPLSIFEAKMKEKCIHSTPIWYLTASMNIVTDIIIFAIPMFPVLKLHMRLQQRLLLLSLFCLGFFICAISCIRITTLKQALVTTDPLWDNAPAAYWSVIELHCGIICACLPTLRPLIQKLMPRLLSTTTDSSKTGASNKFSRLDKKTKHNVHEGNCIRKDININIEMHSTTELSKNAGHRSSFEDTASQ